VSALPTKRLRREETTAEITRLKTELKSWLDERRKKDSREQYKTQLDRIEAQVGGAAEYLLCQLGQKVDLTRSGRRSLRAV
jgi:hypothetical protein